MSLESPSCPGTCCGELAEEAWIACIAGGWIWDTAVRALEASRPPAIFNDLEV